MSEPKTHCPKGHPYSGDNLYMCRGSQRCKECRRRVVRESYQRNKAQRSATTKAWRLANAERHRENAKRWARENPERANMISRLKKHRWRTSGTLTRQEWLDVLAVHGNRCLACGTTENITIDHVVPTSLGGTNTADNVQPLCGTCNTSKGDRIIDFRLWIQTLEGIDA